MTIARCPRSEPCEEPAHDIGTGLDLLAYNPGCQLTATLERTMRMITSLFSRRQALLAAIGTTIGLGIRAAGAQSADAASPQSANLRGKIALVTGSTDGLGREVAIRLAALGAQVIVHGRSRERGADVVRQIESAGGKATFYAADLASLSETRKLAETVRANHERLDILVNNAGIGTGGSNERQTSADGHELVFAVNYLSGYLLTHLLLPLLERGAPARIVNVSSLAQQPIDFDDVMLTRGFSGSRAYSQSKLAQILFTVDLSDELAADRITVNSLHPATLMNTTMVKKAGRAALTTVGEGADAVMQLAVSPALAGRTGLYFNGLNEARANAQAYDADARAKLRMLSRKLTGVG
jgi:NAD(P)-dependent dehydrogenase (short-subunit alcohol dehydrogenase family)